MGEFEAKTTVNMYRNNIYVCIKSSKIPGSRNSGFQIEWNYKESFQFHDNIFLKRHIAWA